MHSLARLESPLSATERTFAEARRFGGTRILDPAPVQSIPSELIRNVDFIAPNQNEAEALPGRPNACMIRNLAEARLLADELLGAGSRGVVLKLGHLGYYVTTADWIGGIPAFDVEAADTTGARDTSNAEFAVSLSEGAPLLKAAQFASAAAAISVTLSGARNSIPTRNVEEKYRTDTRKAVC